MPKNAASVAVAACGAGSEGSSGDLARAMRSDGFVGLTADQLREVLTRVPVNLTASVTAGATSTPLQSNCSARCRPDNRRDQLLEPTRRESPVPRDLVRSRSMYVFSSPAVCRRLAPPTATSGICVGSGHVIESIFWRARRLRGAGPTSSASSTMALEQLLLCGGCCSAAVAASARRLLLGGGGCG